MNRILVIRGGAIGDFLLTLPALKLLREGFPSAQIEILGYKHIIALAEIGGYANATRSIEYAPLSSFFSRGGELAPELVEYFGSFQQIVSYLFDPDQIFANNLRRSGVRNLIVGSPKITGAEHAARQLARPLERLALYLDDPAAVIQFKGQLEGRAPRAPDFSGVAELRPPELDQSSVAIHPGSGSEAKNWPLDRFAEIAREILAPNEKQKLILIGGEADAKRVVDLRAVLPNERVRVAQNLPLTELANLLRACDFFIGHDSGISHLAAAVGTRSLLLFGPTDPAVWAPANSQVRVLRSSSLTMPGIEVAQVRDAVRELRN